MDKSDIKIQSILSAIKTTPLENITSKKIELMNEIGKIRQGVFVEPITLPIPNDAPPELPRVIITSLDKSRTIQIGYDNVLHSLTSIGDPCLTLDEFSKEFFADNLSLPDIFKTLFNAEITRIGIVIICFVYLKENTSANELLSGLFFKKELLGDFFNLDFRLFHKIPYENQKLNRLVKFEPLRRRSNQEIDDALSITVDLNTGEEKKNGYDKDDIMRIQIKIADIINKEIPIFMRS